MDSRFGYEYAVPGMCICLFGIAFVFFIMSFQAQAALGPKRPVQQPLEPLQRSPPTSN